MFRFFADAAQLESLTPPFLRFRILTPLPLDLRQGSLIDYRLRVHGVPIRWRTRIEAFEPPVRFVDTQLSGPYRVWRHEHRFRAAAGGTLCEDSVHYDIGFGPLGRIAHALFVRRDLERIFDYRAAVLPERLATFLGVPRG